jgi:hypothetical protein
MPQGEMENSFGGQFVHVQRGQFASNAESCQWTLFQSTTPPEVDQGDASLPTSPAIGSRNHGQLKNVLTYFGIEQVLWKIGPGGLVRSTHIFKSPCPFASTLRRVDLQSTYISSSHHVPFNPTLFVSRRSRWGTCMQRARRLRPQRNIHPRIIRQTQVVTSRLWIWTIGQWHDKNARGQGTQTVCSTDSMI